MKFIKHSDLDWSYIAILVIIMEFIIHSKEKMLLVVATCHLPLAIMIKLYMALFDMHLDLV